MSSQINQDVSGSESGVSNNQGHYFMSSFQRMHDLAEKLTLLEYSKHFCGEYKCKPIHR